MNRPRVARLSSPDRSPACSQDRACSKNLRSSFHRWGAGFCVLTGLALTWESPAQTPLTEAGSSKLEIRSSQPKLTGSPRADLSLGAVAAPSKDTSAHIRASSLAHYAAALQLEGEGKLREALGHYISAVRADPSNAQMAKYAAELTLNFTGREAAIRLLQDCAKANPTSAAATLNLANFLITYPGDDPFAKNQAADVLADAVRRFPQEIEVYRLAVVYRLTHQERDAALKLMEQAASQAVAEPDYWLALGRLAQEVWPLSQPESKGNHRDKVNPFFVTALKHAPLPNREDVHLAVARFYLVSNQLEAALAVTEPLTKASAALEPRKLLVALYQATGKEPEALHLLEELSTAEPDNIEIHRTLAGIYEGKMEQAENANATAESSVEGRYTDLAKQAIPHREAIIRISGGSREDYVTLSRLLINAREAEKALEFLHQRAHVQFPDDASLCLYTAIASRLLRRYDEAIKYYERTETIARAVASTRLSPDFYQAWGDTLQAVKRFDEAALRYQKAIGLLQQDDPEKAATILNNLGYMWLEQGKNLDQAGEFIRKAVKLAPDSLAYLDSLGWYHFLKAEYPQALKVLLEVEAKLPKADDPENAEIFDHIAQAYEKLGDRAKAVSYYERAATLAPSDEAIHARYKRAKGNTAE